MFKAPMFKAPNCKSPQRILPRGLDCCDDEHLLLICPTAQVLLEKFCNGGSDERSIEKARGGFAARASIFPTMNLSH
jgi:hypothetical protein